MRKASCFFLSLALFCSNAWAEGPAPASSTSIAQKKSASPIKVKRKGGINPEVWTSGETSTLAFDGFPKSVQEFEALQEKIGKMPEGAVLLQLMAFELYLHDRAAGEECIALNNVDNNIPSVLRILKDRYNANYGDYYTPYLVASFLQGSSPNNAYKVSKPYMVQIRSHKVNAYQDSNILKGTVIYLQAQSSGYDTEWRPVSVVKQKGSPYYKVVESSSMYMQCKPVSFKIEDEFVDLWKQ